MTPELFMQSYASMEFRRYHWFGHILTIPNQKDGGIGFQLKLLEILLEDYSMVMTDQFCWFQAPHLNQLPGGP